MVLPKQTVEMTLANILGHTVVGERTTFVKVVAVADVF
jgi:hypothetical protein